MKKFLLLLLFTGFFAATLPAQELEYFEGSYTELLSHAKKKRRPFFIDFYTSWCGYCKKMDATTFRDPNLTKYVKSNWIAYKIDAEKGEGPGLAKKNLVSAYPTFVMFDAKGNRIGQVRGYKDANGFMAALKGFHEQLKTTTRNAVSADFGEYLNLKSRLIKSLESEINKDKDSKLKEYEEKAMAFGEEKNQFELGELKYDLKKKYEGIEARLDVKYFEGMGNQAKYAQALQKLLVAPGVSTIEKHFIVILLLEQDVATIDCLKVLNEMMLKKETFDLLDTKAAVQLMYGDVDDAKETALKAKKIGKKKKKNTASSDKLLEVINSI